MKSPLIGTFIPPGDKSISHRVAILAALANGKSFIKNFLQSGDTNATLTALSHLGVEVIHKNDGIEIIGRGLKGLKKPRSVLDLKNSGTSLRLLTGLLSAQPFSSTLTGDRSLRRRPMGELLRYLRRMGAFLNAHVETAPIFIEPCVGKLMGISCTLTRPSAQVKSALLLASLYSEGVIEIEERIPTRDHTERLFLKMGIPIVCHPRESGDRPLLKIEGARGEIQWEGTSFNIPGDLSSASFFMVAALLLPHSELEIRSVGLNPTRTGFIDIARAMGGKIEVEIVEDNDEPFGNIYVKSSELKGISVPESLTIRAIDEIPLVCLLATQAEGKTEIFGIDPLHFKESDRVSAITEGLSQMGANISWRRHPEPRRGEGSLQIKGPTPLHGAAVQSEGDHRMAMMFFIASQIAKGDVQIGDLSSISVSFPDFLKVFQALCH